MSYSTFDVHNQDLKKSLNFQNSRTKHKSALRVLKDSMYSNESIEFGEQDVAACLRTLCTAMGKGWISVAFPKFCGLGSVCVLPSYYRRGACRRSHLTFFSARCGSLALPGEGIYLYSDATLQFPRRSRLLGSVAASISWLLRSKQIGEIVFIFQVHYESFQILPVHPSDKKIPRYSFNPTT